MIDKLIIEAENNNLTVKEISTLPPKFNGIIINNDIILKKNLERRDKIVTLCEEIEHYKLNVGNIIDIRNTSIKKQELLARWSTYEKLLTFNKIIDAIENGVKNIFEFAEFLDLPEQFVIEGINYYRQRFGSVKVQNYYIKFGNQLRVYKFSNRQNNFKLNTFETYIAGITKVNDSGLDIQRLIKEYIKENKCLSGKLTLVQDPGNPYDKFAIKIVNDHLGHIGYIPTKHAVKVNSIIDNKEIINIASKLNISKDNIYYFSIVIKYI